MSNEERLKDAALAVKWEGWRWMTWCGARAIFHPDEEARESHGWTPATGDEPLMLEGEWDISARDEWILPHYHTDVAAAMRLLEAATPKGWQAVIRLWHKSVDIIPSCAFYDDDGHIFCDSSRDTLPAAIVAAVEALA